MSASRMPPTLPESPFKPSSKRTESSDSNRQSARRGALFVDLVFADSARVPPLQNDQWDLPSDYDELASRMFGLLGQPLPDPDALLRAKQEEEYAPIAGPSSKPMTTSNLHLLGTKRRELLETEHTLVNRLSILQDHYARPLADARGRDGQLLVKKYHHNRMFNNLDKILESHRQLDADLHHVCRSNDPLWAHVLANHLERNTPQYVAYFAGYEHGSALARSYTKGNKQFEDFASSTKLKTAKLPDSRNSDLNALLAEPVQRVPRYKYMLKDMLPLLPEEDPNVPYIYHIFRLVDDISKYRDEEGRRAAILWSMSITVQDLPFTLWSSQRRYLASVDVEDLPLDSRHTFSLDGRNSPEALCCTLFLFTDCLLITKRIDPRTNGRHAVGLDDIDNLVQAANQPDVTNINHSSGGGNKLMNATSPSKARPQSPIKPQRSNSSGSALRKHILKARGLVSLQHVTATDLGSKGFVLHLAQPPSDASWSKRWNDQSLRHYIVSPTPGSDGLNVEKNRFLETLWDSQARCSGRTGVNTSGAPSPGKKPAGSEGGQPPCTVFKNSLEQSYAQAELDVSEVQKQALWSVYFAAWAAEDYANTSGVKNRLALHIDVTGRATSRLMLDTSGPPNVVANAQAESPDSLSLDIQARGRSDSVLSLTNVSPARVLTRSIKSALDLGLYNYMPKLSTLSVRPPISPTATTEHTRTRTGSLFGGTSTLGKNTIRNSVFGGAMTPIHDSKRTDTVRSGASTSTAGDSHVSSLFSNGHTPSTLASSTMSEHDESMVMVQRDPSYEEMWRKSPGMTGRLTKSPPLQSSGIPRKVTDESLMRANRLGSIGSISQMLEPHGVANVKESVSDDNMGRSQSMDELRASQMGSSDRRRRAVSVPPQAALGASTSERPPDDDVRHEGQAHGGAENDAAETSMVTDEEDSSGRSSRNKRPFAGDADVPLRSKKSAISSLSVATATAGEANRNPRNPRRRESSGRFRRASAEHDVPVARPAPSTRVSNSDSKDSMSLKAELQRLKEENEVLREQHKRLDEEVQTAFDAFNEEIEQVYQDIEQDFPELQSSLLSDLHATKVARFSAEAELRIAKRELALRDLRLQQYEQAYGPLTDIREEDNEGDRGPRS